ncbi:MAG: ABC transporter permease [Nitrospinota bacterium]|jgi:lipooligosaccharide transport system permease protein|nr:ABC transporter permease [Nitrospinota bacterium]
MIAAGMVPSRRALRVWLRHLVQYRSFYVAEWAGNFGEHVLYLLAFGYGLGRLVPSLNGISYAQFIGPGLVVSIAMWTSTFESTYGAYNRMRVQKTYEAMMSAPLSLGDIVLGDLLWCGTRAIIGATLMMIVLSLFGLIGSLWWALSVLPIIFLVGLMFGSLGLVSAGLAPSFSFFSFHFSLVVMPMFFFAETLFPLRGLPDGLRLFSQMLPLTHAVKIVRGLIIFGRVDDFLFHLFILAGSTLVFMACATISVSRRMMS